MLSAFIKTYRVLSSNLWDSKLISWVLLDLSVWLSDCGTTWQLITSCWTRKCVWQKLTFADLHISNLTKVMNVYCTVLQTISQQNWIKWSLNLFLYNTPNNKQLIKSLNNYTTRHKKSSLTIVDLTVCISWHEKWCKAIQKYARVWKGMIS